MGTGGPLGFGWKGGVEDWKKGRNPLAFSVSRKQLSHGTLMKYGIVAWETTTSLKDDHPFATIISYIDSAKLSIN